MISLLIGLVITLLIVGVVYWAAMKLMDLFSPPPVIPVAIQIIFVLIALMVLLGFLEQIGGVHVPMIR